MGHAIVYCATCGQRIQERDIAMSRVLEDQGRFFCANCHGSAPETAVTYVTEPQETPTVLRDVPAMRSRHAPPPPPPPRGGGTPILGAIIAFVVVVAVGGGAAFFLLARPSAPPPAPPPLVKKEDPLKVAQAEADKLDEFRRSTTDPALIATRAKETLAKVDGTPYAERVRGVLREAERALELKKGEASVEELLARARKLADADPEFAKRSDVRAVYKEARAVADKLASTRLSLKVGDAESAYDRSFEEAARAAVRLLGDRINALVREEKLDEALAAFDTLPAIFKDTAEGRQLENEKRRFQEQLARLRREAKMTIIRDFQRATSMMNEADKGPDPAKGYKDSADLYATVLADVNNDAKVREQELTAQQVAQVKAIGHYNVACYFARFTKDVDKAVANLEKSIEAGYNDWKHLDEDTDLDKIRKDPKFTAMLKKYRKE